MRIIYKNNKRNWGKWYMQITCKVIRKNARISLKGKWTLTYIKEIVMVFARDSGVLNIGISYLKINAIGYLISKIVLN